MKMEALKTTSAVKDISMALPQKLPNFPQQNIDPNAVYIMYARQSLGECFHEPHKGPSQEHTLLSSWSHTLLSSWPHTLCALKYWENVYMRVAGRVSLTKHHTQPLRDLPSVCSHLILGTQCPFLVMSFPHACNSDFFPLHRFLGPTLGSGLGPCQRGELCPQ